MLESTRPPPRTWVAFVTLVVAALASCASAPEPAPPSAVAPATVPLPVPVPQASATAIVGTGPTDAGNAAIAQQLGFARWITRFQEIARAAGIEEATLRMAFDDIHYRARVIELDQAQPEFTRTIWEYLDIAVSAQRIARGQDKLLHVHAEADAAALRYGVPASVLVAIWGSMADVMASTANFLARSGWQAGQPWGAEVRLPQGFNYGRADAAIRRSSAEWAAEGVRSMEDAPLPDFADGSVLLPAGARGPAFLIGANFRAILRYNNATSYALAVGLLAQRLIGGFSVQAPWPRDLAALTRVQLRALQTALNQRGFPSGPPDGVMRPATRDGIRRYQRSVGLPADGYPDLDLLARLQAR